MQKQKGFSLIELIIVVLVISIIAVIAIPNLLSARRAANEGSAISTLRTLHGAQSTYLTTTGRGNYAGTTGTTADTSGLTELADAELIDLLLATGTKSGYNFVGARTSANPGAGTPATFYFSANPVNTSGTLRSGTKRFCITQQGFIGWDSNNLATVFDAASATGATPLN